MCPTKKAAKTEDIDPFTEGTHTYETIRNYLRECISVECVVRIIKYYILGDTALGKQVFSLLAASNINKSFLLWKLIN